MEEKKNNRAILVVTLALVAVMAVLLAVFMLRSDSGQEGIVLPATQKDPVSDKQPENEAIAEFLELSTENVLPALRSLSRPQYYHQSFEVTRLGASFQVSHQVELWYNGGLIHAELRTQSQVKSVFTDGETVWIWYDSDLTPICLTLDSSVTLEDLLGLPAFDYLDTLEGETIVDAGYETPDENGSKLVFVCTKDASTAKRYWVDLESGLLCQSDVLEDSQQVYLMTQTAFDRLAPGDQAFSGRFCLPDGSEPFIVERETQQP